MRPEIVWIYGNDVFEDKQTADSVAECSDEISLAYISISSLRAFLEKMPNHNGYIENRNSYYKAVDEILQWLQQEVK